MASKQKRNTRRVELLPTLLIVLLLAIVGWQLMTMNEKLGAARSEQEQLAERIARQEQENRGLEAALARAEDPEYLQELARDQLSMVTPGQKDFYDVSN